MGVSAIGGTNDVLAPDANGTNASGPSASTVSEPSAAVTTAVVEASATRGASGLTAMSTISNTTVSLFGDVVVTAGAISADVSCPLDGVPVGSSAAANVAIGVAAPVTLSSTGPSTTMATADVTSNLFVDGVATLTVTAVTGVTTSPSAAGATGLGLVLVVASGTLVAGGVDLSGTTVGVVVLADTVCVSPTGPDAVASSVLSIARSNGPVTGGTTTTSPGRGSSGPPGSRSTGLPARG